MPSTNPFEQINDLFASYARALEQFDAKAMALHHGVPCTFLSDEAATVFTESSKLEGLFVQGAGFYKQFGIAHAHPDIPSKQFLTDKICKAKVTWKYYDRDGQPMYNCDYHYILRLEKGHKWRIDVSVSVNEKERMEEWLGKKK